MTASYFAVQSLRNNRNQIERISIYLALINCDPDWDPNQLLFSSDGIPLINIFSPKYRILLLAGINLTFGCVSAHDNALFFVIVESDEDKSNIEQGQEEEDEEIKSSFNTLKRNLEELIKKYPRLLTVQVLLVHVAFLHFHCLLTTNSPEHDVIAGQEWANSDRCCIQAHEDDHAVVDTLAWSVSHH